MAVFDITKENFENEVLNSQIPVLVDFWAGWCMPCRMLSPIVDEVAEENAGAIKVCKVNVDDQPELAMRYGATSIPTLIIFKNGEPVRSSVGVRPKRDIEALIKE